MTDRIRVSWSSLKRWENCHQQWKKRADGHGSKAKNVRMFLEGTVTDRVMRAWLESMDPQPGQMVKMAPEFLTRYANPGEGSVKWGMHDPDPKKDYAFALAKITKALTNLEPWLMEYVIPFEYHPELRFTATVGLPHPVDGTRMGVDLIGGIDLAVKRSDDDYRLYDLKTTTRPEYIRETLGQGVFYDLAFGIYIGAMKQPTQFGFIAPLLDPAYYPADVTEDDRRLLVTRIMAMVHGIVAKDFLPKASDAGCKWCEVKHVCDKFQIGNIEPDEHGRRRASFVRAGQFRSAILANEAREGV